MNPEPIWDWPSSVQFLGRYRVEGESSKFRNSVGYITAMNALQCNAMATDAIMAKHRGGCLVLGESTEQSGDERRARPGGHDVKSSVAGSRSAAREERCV